MQICHLEAKIRFLTGATIPLWAGNGFMAMLGNRLKDRVCAVHIPGQEELSVAMTRRPGCKRDCQLSHHCHYGRLFKSPSRAGQERSAISAMSFEPALSLILMPPATGSYDPGDCASIGFAAIGPALDSLPYLFLALRDLGRSGIGRDRQTGSGRFELESADCLTCQEREPVYRDGNLQSRISTFSYQDLLRRTEQFNGSVALDFAAPTHIGDNVVYSSRPSFRMLLGHLLLRANALSSWHGKGFLFGHRECQRMLENAEKIEQVSAFVQEVFPRRQARASMQKEAEWQPPYFLGEIVYRGSFSRQIMALLSLGQIIHVGRAACAGNGLFRMKKRPPHIS
jgi:hypothetical protein